MRQPSQPGTGRSERPSGATNEVIERYIPLVEAAERLGVHPRTLRGWGAEGVNGCPKPVRLGGRNLHFHQQELVDWIQSRKMAAEESGASR